MELTIRKARPDDAATLSMVALQAKAHWGYAHEQLEVWGREFLKDGEFPRQQLLQLCEVPNPLWVNGFRSYNGINDRIPEAQADLLNSSLVLIEPQNLIVSVERGLTKRQVRVGFHVAGQSYKLTITDPQVEREFLSRGEGRYTHQRQTVACVSIGEPFQGYRYKLVASIIDL